MIPVFLCQELEQNDNNNLLAQQFQWFTGIVLQGFHCLRFVTVLSMLTCCWFTITSGIAHCCLSFVHLILRQYNKQNDNSNLLAEWFQWNTGIVLQVNCCYHFIDMSGKQRNTGINLIKKPMELFNLLYPKCLMDSKNSPGNAL